MDCTSLMYLQSLPPVLPFQPHLLLQIQVTTLLLFSNTSSISSPVSTSNDASTSASANVTNSTSSAALSSSQNVINILWHNKLGHPHHNVLCRVLQHLNVSDNFFSMASFCEVCKLGKLHQMSFSSLPLKTSQPLQIVHFDLWSPSPCISSTRIYGIFNLKDIAITYYS